jgi:NAD(P)-dependent dehydrogenase (short-subunit alcohol dehydrogenase family)
MAIENLDLQFLKSKTILVTGASSGIGKAVAEKLLDLGNIVIGTSRLDRNLKETSEKFPRNFYSYSLNLSNFDEILKLSSYISKTFGKLDVLVNNAGILGQTTTIEDYDIKKWIEVININLNGQVLLAKELLPLLKKSKKGSIINISSSVGRVPRKNWGAYSVSKAGLEAVTDILCQELEKYDIIVNSVNPGGTATKMRKEAYPDEDQTQLPSPNDILPIILYLSSDEATESGYKFNAREYIGALQNF